MRESNQKERLQKLKQGPGTFTYLGGACDTHAEPGIPLIGKDGNQVVTVPLVTVQDAEGNPVTVADPKGGGKGRPVWKKAPQFIRKELKTFKLALPGVPAAYDAETGTFVAKAGADGKVPQLFLELEKGKPTYVGDARLALKLRCLKFFKESEDAKPKGKSEDAKQ